MKQSILLITASVVVLSLLSCWLVMRYLRKPQCSLEMLSKSIMAGADCYLINLDRHPDRLQFFQKQFRNSDISTVIPSFIRFPAVDAQYIDWQSFLSERALKEAKELQKTKYRRHHYQLTPGAVGCYLSHWQTWKTHNTLCGVEVLRAAAGAGVDTRDAPPSLAEFQPSESSLGGFFDDKNRSLKAYEKQRGEGKGGVNVDVAGK